MKAGVSSKGNMKTYHSVNEAVENQIAARLQNVKYYI